MKFLKKDAQWALSSAGWGGVGDACTRSQENWKLDAIQEDKEL